MSKDSDQEYQDNVVTSVETGKDGWSIGMNGTGFWIAAEHGVEPHVGDSARFYGRGLGSVVRGVDLNGVEVFYRTPDEQEEENRRQSRKWRQDKIDRFESEGRVTLDAQYDALPDVFRQRLDRFRRNNSSFRWEHEAYEMSCCVDAVKIAAVCPAPDDVKAFHGLSWEQQKAKVTDLFDGHSGNSFGKACQLASAYVSKPKLVPLLHGALCPLVGCEEYGCAPLPSHADIAAASP